jgi:hypothetical protein
MSTGPSAETSKPNNAVSTMDTKLEVVTPIPRPRRSLGPRSRSVPSGLNSSLRSW